MQKPRGPRRELGQDHRDGPGRHRHRSCQNKQHKRGLLCSRRIASTCATAFSVDPTSASVKHTACEGLWPRERNREIQRLVGSRAVSYTHLTLPTKRIV